MDLASVASVAVNWPTYVMLACHAKCNTTIYVLCCLGGEVPSNISVSGKAIIQLPKIILLLQTGSLSHPSVLVIKFVSCLNNLQSRD